MKKTTVNKEVKVDLLCEELFDAFPSWIQPHPLGFPWGYTEAIVTEEFVEFPDNTDTTEVDEIVRKHDKNKESKNEKAKKDKDKNRAEAIKKLKQLGLTDAEIDAIIRP